MSFPGGTSPGPGLEQGPEHVLLKIISPHITRFNGIDPAMEFQRLAAQPSRDDRVRLQMFQLYADILLRGQ